GFQRLAEADGPGDPLVEGRGDGAQEGPRLLAVHRPAGGGQRHHGRRAVVAGADRRVGKLLVERADAGLHPGDARVRGEVVASGDGGVAGDLRSGTGGSQRRGQRTGEGERAGVALQVNGLARVREAAVVGREGVRGDQGGGGGRTLRRPRAGARGAVNRLEHGIRVHRARRI